jgi:hypothetical protein
MSLVEHAKTELEMAGLFDDDADYGGMVGRAVMDLIEVFAGQGHSGLSAAITLAAFDKVARFKNLKPITSDPAEWNDVSQASGRLMWQSKRDSTLFSNDGGQTWYSIEVEDGVVYRTEDGRTLTEDDILEMDTLARLALRVRDADGMAPGPARYAALSEALNALQDTVTKAAV